jgi:hypothetical protein
LSWQEPVAWLSEEGAPYSVKQRDDAGFGDYYPNQQPLIVRPSALIAATKENKA